jgi:uncharacterized membrane protein YfcA
MHQWLFLAGAGFLAGAMNALAGGGSFVSLPALIATGMPSVLANASSTVALWPGGGASVWMYRQGLRDVAGVPVRALATTTIAGGAVGGLLLLWTPSSLFDTLLPWLLLVATLTLAFGRRLGETLRRHRHLPRLAVLIVQALLGIYGGYYGGAVGIMMMAVWSLLDGADMKALNASRTLMVSAANGAAVLCFILARAVVWPAVLAVAAGAIAGGAGGAWLGLRLPATIVRRFTLALCAIVTAFFFVHSYR